MSSSDVRPFTFLLRSRSACHLRAGAGVNFFPPQNNESNFDRAIFVSEYCAGKPAWLRVYVECRAASLEDAVTEFGTLIGSELQHLAVATNSMIAWPEFQVGLEKVNVNNWGAYLEEARSQDLPPPVGYRLLDPDVHFRVTEAMRTHKYALEIQQIASVYGVALEMLDHRNNLLVAELAYIATEHLARLRVKRYEEEDHLPHKQIAVKLGIERIAARGNGLFNEIAIREVYGGNRELYERHKIMSDGFEHGFGLFKEIRTSSDELVLDLLALVRKALINCLNLPEQTRTKVLSNDFEKPLAGWLPRVHLEGKWRPHDEGLDLEALLSAQELRQSNNGAVCFSDLSLNIGDFGLTGSNSGSSRAEINYTGQRIEMPSDGLAKIAKSEVVEVTMTPRSSTEGA